MAQICATAAVLFWNFIGPPSGYSASNPSKNVRKADTALMRNVDMGDLRRSLDTKFVWIVTTMIVFGTGLLVAMAKGFHWLK